MAKNFTQNIKPQKTQKEKVSPKTKPKISAEQSEKIANELHQNRGTATPKTKALNFNIPLELYQRIDAQARRKGLSKKALITAALWEAFAEG